MTTLALPQGTVTLFFCDLEGSTRLLADLRKNYIELLATHRSILREIISEWEGYEVDASGDAYFAAFPRAINALHTAIDVQKRISVNPWPNDVEVKLRMGLHTGEPWLEEEGYIGLDVHRAAQIVNLAHGGQVLLSETTAYLTQDELPPGTSLFERGVFSLKDIERTVRVYELVIEV